MLFSYKQRDSDAALIMIIYWVLELVASQSKLGESYYGLVRDYFIKITVIRIRIAICNLFLQVRTRLSLCALKAFPGMPLRSLSFSHSTPIGLDCLGWRRRMSSPGEYRGLDVCLYSFWKHYWDLMIVSELVLCLFSGVCGWLSICGYVQVHKVKMMLVCNGQCWDCVMFVGSISSAVKVLR